MGRSGKNTPAAKKASTRTGNRVQSAASNDDSPQADPSKSITGTNTRSEGAAMKFTGETSPSNGANCSQAAASATASPDEVEVETEAATATTSSSAAEDVRVDCPMPRGWDSTHFRSCIAYMTTMETTSKNGKVKPLVPATYTRETHWSTMEKKKKEKILRAWNSLGREVQNEVLAHQVRALLQSEQVAKQWNKDDTARLIHLFADASHTSTWTNLVSRKTRRGIDNKSGFGGPSPLKILADAFNNYDANQYHNIAVHVRENNHMEAAEEHTFLFSQVSDINPSNSKRPHRNPEEIEARMRDLKSHFATSHRNYHASGSGDTGSDNAELEFANYVNGDMLLVYAFAVWQQVDIRMLGKIGVPVVDNI